MKFLKFCIDTDFVDKHISDDMDVKDIRFIKEKINSTYNEIEITCIVESDNEIGCKDTKDCNKVKLGKGKVDLGKGRTVNWLQIHGFIREVIYINKDVGMLVYPVIINEKGTFNCMSQGLFFTDINKGFEYMEDMDCINDGKYSYWTNLLIKYKQ